MDGLEYIHRKIEPRISRREKEKSKEEIKELEQSFGVVKWDETGNITLENFKMRIRIGYESSEIGKDWRRLVSLELQMTDRENAVPINLLSDLNQGVVIHFKIKNFNADSKIRTDGTEVRLCENILTSKGLIVFLHEIGHDVYRRFKEAKGIKQDRSSFLGLLAAPFFLDKEKLAEDLRDERYASAYALKKLRPFIKRGIISKAAALNLIHQGQLQRYASYLRDTTEGPIRSILNDIKFLLADEFSNPPEHEEV